MAGLCDVRGKEGRRTGQKEENCTETLSGWGSGVVANIYEPSAEGEFFLIVLAVEGKGEGWETGG